MNRCRKISLLVNPISLFSRQDQSYQSLSLLHNHLSINIASKAKKVISLQSLDQGFSYFFQSLANKVEVLITVD